MTAEPKRIAPRVLLSWTLADGERIDFDADTTLQAGDELVFAAEAEKYGVYPLDDRFAARAVNKARPSVVRGRKSFVYAAGTTRIPEGSHPSTNVPTRSAPG